MDVSPGSIFLSRKKNSKIECEKDVYIQHHGEKFNKENYFKWSKTRKEEKKQSTKFKYRTTEIMLHIAVILY